ncbi:hypothetical protein E4H04_10875 [Candidatus Bathyarchaeota archaeon]|nr:MAG: hypothetical protein E4H04_10875 [Candidatus Bathyarchaeota archaeon]
MVDYQTISIVFTGLSISLAAFYYISTLMNAQRNQQQQLETRQAQLLATLFNTYRSIEFRRLWHQVMVFDWKDFDDWEKRFSEITNAEAIASFTSVMSFFSGVGVFVKNNFIDIKLVYDLIGGDIKMTWERYLPIFMGDREFFKNPTMWRDFEYLYNLIVEYDPESINVKQITDTFEKYSKQTT